MGPIELLVAEHRVIESVLDELAAWGAAAARGEAPERSQLRSAVEFLRGFADAIHHGKEEQVLFAALERQPDLPERLRALIVLNRREHETGRMLVSDLARLAQEGPWTDGERRRLASACKDYVSLLRRHIAEEDRDLFPLAEQSLSGPLRAQVAAACDQFEQEHQSQGQTLRLVAERLAAAH